MTKVYLNCFSTTQTSSLLGTPRALVYVVVTSFFLALLNPSTGATVFFVKAAVAMLRSTGSAF